MKISNRIRIWISNHEQLCSILAISFIGLIAFLPSVKNCGFYADDYHMVYGAFTSGPDKILSSYMIDRPGAGIVLDLLYRLFGANIHYYQAIVIILDISIGLCALWIIRTLWPNQKTTAFAVALMAVIYPGFNEFMESFNFSLMLMSISFYIFSIALSIKVLTSKRPVARILLTVLSAILSLWSVLLNEYYLGLEVLRIGVIIVFINDKMGAGVSKIKLFLKALSAYIPYLFTAGGFFIWRFFFFSNQRNATDLGHFIDLFIGSPVYKLLTILSGLFNSLLNITLFAWFEPAYRYLNSLRLKDFLFCSAIAFVGAVIVYFLYRSRISKENETYTSKKELLQFVILGLVTVIGTSLPIVFVNREVTFTEYSKYSLSGMIGGILILAGLIHYFVKPSFRPLLIAFLVFSGIVTQLAVGKNLATEWKASKDMWWQLSWRAPSLKPGTMLTGLNINYRLEEGFNFWGPANLIYYPTAKNPVITGETLNADFIKAIQMDKDPQRNFRTYQLDMETNNLLVMSVPSEVSCLHLINGTAPDYSIYDSSSIQLVGKYSKLDRIDVTAELMSPPTVIFDAEPAHGWCYYYQKAELSAQMGDYQEVARLREEAESQDLRPNDQIELLPFILAYAELNEPENLKEVLPMFFDSAYHKVNYCANVMAENYNISESANQLLLNLSCLE
jgi:hypothetical protein